MSVARRGSAMPRAEPGPRPSAYEADFYSWAHDQASLLKTGRLNEIDAANIAEELEDLGSERFRRLESAVRVILIHCLKWDFQPERRSHSWVASIRVRQLNVEYLLRDNPALKGRLTEALERAYRKARVQAVGQTKLEESKFPAQCPYLLGEILERRFEWPARSA